MALERLSNLGYFGLIKEAVPGTPLTPTDYIPLYEETIQTDGQFIDLAPAYGGKFGTLTTIPGIRTFKGDITCLAEPNTAARLVNAMLTQGTPSGSNPTTFPFTLTNTTPPTYTFDLSLANIVKRYWGVAVSKITPVWNSNEMRLKVTVSALGSFEGREIASVAGSGPYTVTLADTQGVFDQNPTKGLVVGDLIRFHHTGSADIDAVVASVPTGTTFTTTTNVSTMIAGDGVHLRPATPSFNNLQSFMWGKTRVGFGTTASNALAATHTPVEIGSGWEVIHNFNDDKGEERSGAFNPAALVRTTADVNVTIKKICDTTEDEIAYNNLAKGAVVFRHFAGTTNQYEFRVTVNHTKMDTPIGSVKVGNLIYVTQNLHTNFDTSDSQAFDIKVISALASGSV